MDTGILAYGVKLPKHRIEADQIWGVWKNLAPSFFDMLSIGERGVLGPEEDSLTLAAAAAETAHPRARRTGTKRRISGCFMHASRN